MMIEQTVVVGPLACNCRLLICDQTREAALIDPGAEAEKIMGAIVDQSKKLGGELEFRYLIHTHAHFDHFGATRSFKERFPRAEILLHKEDLPLYEKLPSQGLRYGFHFDEPLPVDRFLADGDRIQLGKSEFHVIHTPGHSPGGCCYYCDQVQRQGEAEVFKKVYTGDTLFREEVGRADLWGGNEQVLFRSIREKLLVLPMGTSVGPGHGAESSVAWERKRNPYVALDS